MTVLDALTLRCDAATRLASDALDRPLTGPERVGVTLHRANCRSCRRANRQFRLLHRANALLREGVALTAAPLPRAARQRIAQRLRDSAQR